MAHLHLPAEHDEDDLAIAGALAAALQSEDLYVAWSREGQARPVIPAAVHMPCEPRRRRSFFGGLFGALSRRRG